MLLGKSKKLRHRWLRMDGDGDTCQVTMSKAAIHNRYGVQVGRQSPDQTPYYPAPWHAATRHQCLSANTALRLQPRDLRLLDALPSSSPPALLVRDKAIVINLEFLKCIITTGATCAPGSYTPIQTSDSACMGVSSIHMWTEILPYQGQQWCMQRSTGVHVR